MYQHRNSELRELQQLLFEQAIPTDLKNLKYHYKKQKNNKRTKELEQYYLQLQTDRKNS